MTPLRWEEWDFSGIEKVEDLNDCYEWEFARENQKLINQIMIWRNGDATFKSLLEKHGKQLLGPPGRRLFTLSPEWPDQPYQSLDPARIKTRLESIRARYVAETDSNEARVSVRLKDVAEDLKSGFVSNSNYVPLSDDSALAVFLVDFTRPMKGIVADIKESLELIRSDYCPHLDGKNAPKGTKGRLSTKRYLNEQLRDLGVWRLLEAVGTWNNAEQYISQQGRESGTIRESPFPRDKRGDSWKAAKQRIEEVFQQF